MSFDWRWIYNVKERDTVSCAVCVEIFVRFETGEFLM